MATQVFKQETFVLQPLEDSEEGREVKITPLPLKPLRKFMAEFERLQELGAEEDDDVSELDATEIFFDCAVIAIQARNKEVTREELEDTLDMPTAMKIVQIAGGMDIDPNLTSPQTGA